MGARTRAGAFGITVAVFTFALALIAGPAAAIDQSNPLFPTIECGGEWHWVHNQVPDFEGTGALTATFRLEDGTVSSFSVVGTPNSAVIHYYLNLTLGATLLSASDDVDGGNLLLSHYPTCQGVTTSTTTDTTTPSSDTTETTEATTSSTTGPETSETTSPTSSTQTTAAQAVTIPPVTPSEETTTTVVNTETTPAVEGATVTTSTTVASTSETTVPPAPPTETLPLTGFDLALLAAAGAGSLATGAAMLATRRRR